MFNYSEGFQLSEARPTGGLLTLHAFRDIQTGAALTGDQAQVHDPQSIFDPTKWNRGDIEKTETYNKFYAYSNLLQTQEGSLTGISNFLNLAKEPLKLAVFRQIMGKDPFKPWEYSDYQLTPEAIEADKKTLDTLVTFAKDNPNAPNIADIQDQIKDIGTKLLYDSARKDAKQELGFNRIDLTSKPEFNWFDLIAAQNWFGLGDPDAGNPKDIEDRLSTFDPNFKPEQWFAENTVDDTVAQAMMENGISAETIANSPNADHARFKIVSILNDSTIKRRMESYKPTKLDTLRLLRDTVAGGIVNNPGETAFGIGVELALAGTGALIGSAVGPAGTAAGAVAGSAVAGKILPAGSAVLRLKRAFDAASTTGKVLRGSRYAVETLYKMPLGIMPSYVANYGLIRSTIATTAFGAVQGFAAEAARQQREIAFGAATLYASPSAMDDYNVSAMVSSAVDSGLVFGGTFGLGGNLLRTGIGATKNRLSGVMLDPATGLRDRTDKSWSLSGTPLGKTFDNFKAKFDKPIIDKPVPEKLAKEAAISGEDVTPEKLVRETEARANRVETREALESVEAARATPEDVGTKRQDGESIPEYLARVGPAKAITNSMEFFNNLARRTVRTDNQNLVGLNDTYSSLSHADQLTFLMDAEAHVKEAQRIETESVGLSRERQKVYEQIELSRKAAIRNLKRKMPAAQYKLTMDEYKKLRKRSDKGIPELLQTVRDKTKSVTERREAAHDAAMRILETAQNAARSKDKEADLKANLPEEVRQVVDAAIVEQKLTDGVISENTMDDVYAVITGDKPKAQRPLNKLQAAIQRANVMARFDTERLAKIKELIDAPEKFLDLVSGNRESAKAFFQFINEAQQTGLITNSDRLLILASTVHLNFNSKAFDIKYAFKPLPPAVSGRFDKPNNTIIINSAPSAMSVSARSTKTSTTILHEIGHAYFRHAVNGDIYREALKAFNRLHFSDRLNAFSLVHQTAEDDFLNKGFGLYYFQNVEELMVESWSKILLLEGEAAIATLKPHETTVAKAVLNKVMDNLILVAQMFDNSDFYYSTKKVLDMAIDLDNKLDQNISVSKLSDIYTDAENAIPSGGSLDDQFAAFNKEVSKLIPDAKARNLTFTKEEFKLWYEEAFTDSAIKVAMLISKSNGRDIVNAKGVTKEFRVFIDSYATYKQAQMASTKTKLAFLLGSTDYIRLRTMTKEERLEYLQENLFSNFGRYANIGPQKVKMLPVTYQEDIGAWNTSGLNLLNAIENLQVTPESALNKAQLDQLVEGLRKINWFNKSPINNLRDYLNSIGLEELSDLAATGLHKQFFDDAKDDGALFNMNNEAMFPEWSTKEIALNNLELMLKNKVDVPAIMNLLQKNMVTEVSQAFLKTAKSAEELVELLNTAIQSDRLVYDATTELWGIPVKVKKAKAPKAKTTRKPKSKKQIKKLADAAQETADITGSTVVTKDNLVKMLEHIALKRPSLGAVISTLFFRQKALIRRIEEGKLQTLDHLINLAKKQDKQETLSEQRKSQQATKAARSAAARPEGEGGGVFFATAKDRVEIGEGERKANLIEVMLNYNKELNGIILSPEEAKTAELLIQFPTDVKLAAALKKSRSSAQRERTKILKKLQSVGEAVGLNESANREEILTAIRQYFDGINKAVEEAKTSTPAETVKKRNRNSSKVQTAPPLKETAAAAVIAMGVARDAKLQNTDPPKVPVVTTEPVTTTAIVLYRATADVTGNKPEPVLRPETQAEALVDNSNVAVKEAVKFTPRNPIKIRTNYNGALPDKIELLKAHALARGNDAIVFGDGVVLPLVDIEQSVVGKVVRQTDPTKPVEATLTKENGVPVRKETPKKRKTTKTPDAPMVVNKIPTKTKPGEPAKTREVEAVPEEQTTPETVQTTETEKLERQTNEDIGVLREHGMDSSFLRLFTAKYWNAKLEKEAPTVLTDGFKAMWTHFVLVNQYIANANRMVLGDDIMVRFWDVVDRIQKENLLLKVTEGPGGVKPLTYSQVLEKAAKEVTPEGKPMFVIPLTPDNIKFVKADADGNYRLSANSKKHRSMIDEAGTEPRVPAPPTKPPAETPIPEKVPTPEKAPEEAPPKTPKHEAIGRVVKANENNTSVLLRESNLFGRIFGGSQRELRGWWRDRMNSLVTITQSSTRLSNTIRSVFHPLSFVSRLFDDTRAQTAHLVAAGKEAHKTAMQIKSEESRLMVAIFREYAKLHAMLPRASRKLAKTMDFLIYDARRQNKTVTAQELINIGIPEYMAKSMATQANAVLKSTYMANKAILGLETETGRIISVDSNGNPLDAAQFAPTQVDHEVLSGLDMLQRVQLIKDLTAARTKRKMKDTVLDRNTMVVLGWLDIKFDPNSKTVTLFSPDRVFSASESNNMFSLDSLDKLRVGFVAAEGITGERGTVLRMLNIADPENYFVQVARDPNTGKITGYDIFRIPKVVDDLAPEDVARYRAAVGGDTAMYTEKWRQKLGGRNLIEVEIEELMKQKTKQYPYNKANAPDSIFKQPHFRLDPADGEVVLPLRGLTPEEFMETDLTKSVLRVNMAEAYFYFLNGRYFELGFQKQINKLTGRLDINNEDLLDYAQSESLENLKVLAESQKWTPAEIDAAQKGIMEGIERLREEYQFNANTAPYLNSDPSAGVRIALSVMKAQLSPGFGISALGELTNEIIKASPNVFSIPKNLVKAFRFVLGDIRLSKRKLLESDIGDMMFVLENFRTDLANRMMGEIGYGAFRTDSRFGTRVAASIANVRNASTTGEKALRTAEEYAKYMQSLGSLQAVTNASRALAKTRLVRWAWGHISSGKLERLITALSDPANADMLAKLKESAMKDVNAERELFKKFSGVARAAGMSGDDAALFMKYGLTTVEQVRHLKWAIEQVRDKDGRVDAIQLMHVQEDLYNNPVKGIDPETLKDAISSYANMIEDLVTKEAVSESRGLNKITKIDAKSPTGRLWNALSSWIRSFQDNVILDYGSRSTVNYLFGGIFLWMVTDTFYGLLKEYLAGREIEDMVTEMEEKPEQFAVRGISRVPFLGIANGLIEAAAWGVAAGTGGSYQYYGVPLLPPGPGATMSTAENMMRDISNVSSSAFMDGEFDVKSFSNLIGGTSLVNRSPVAIPVRVLESNNAFREYDAIQQYLDTVHRNPYPYRDKAIKRSRNVMLPETPQLPPRNYLMESKRAIEDVQKAEKTRNLVQPKEPMVEDQSGVSTRLGDILEGYR